MSDPTPLERDLNEAAQRTRNMTRPNQVIAEMFAYSSDLRRQGILYARAKSHAERRVAQTVTTRKVNDPKEPVSLSEHHATDLDDVYVARVAYRTAEALMTADREHLRVLHAELDKLRTEAADRRAADSFTRPPSR